MIDYQIVIDEWSYEVDESEECTFGNSEIDVGFLERQKGKQQEVRTRYTHSPGDVTEEWFPITGQHDIKSAKIIQKSCFENLLYTGFSIQLI